MWCRIQADFLPAVAVLVQAIGMVGHMVVAWHAIPPLHGVICRRQKRGWHGRPAFRSDGTNRSEAYSRECGAGGSRACQWKPLASPSPSPAPSSAHKQTRLTDMSRTRPLARLAAQVSTRPPSVARTPFRRLSSSWAHLESELTARRLPLVYDYLVPTSSHLLNIALADILPSSSAADGTATPTLPTLTTSPSGALPQTHHLIYFPPPIPGAQLLPDGTDPLQSPGPPFVRRMWAGGAVSWAAANTLPLDGARAACLEAIRSVAVKGTPGSEKIFVGIERRVGRLVRDDEPERETRARLWRDDDADPGDAAVVERRNIVFMREQQAPASAAAKAPAATKAMPPPHADPDFSHACAPSARLLFRYSALTYNAHAIHLDPSYCRDVEGHRGLLVHGPLSFTLVTTMLRRVLAERRGGRERIASVEYRNLAPLYAGETLRLCGKEVKPVEGGGKGRWDVWVETPEGGVALKGTVRTEAA